MFEDIDETIRRGPRKPSKPEGFNPNRGKDSDGIEDEIGKDIADFIEKKYGGRAVKVRGGIAYMPAGRHGSDDPHKEIYDKLEGMIKSLSYMAEELKVKPTCLDANKAELVVGDVLKCPGGETKTVLKVGWKFAMLSHTEDQTKLDAPWFEDEISYFNFIKKP